VVCHVTFLAADFIDTGETPFHTIYQLLSLASVLIVGGYLLVLVRYPITVLGAFITPVTLLFLLGSALRQTESVPTGVRSVLLPLHIAANVLGVVAFALAFAVAVAYVLQERQLRRKKLGGLFQRLPALDVLDSMGFRLIMVGFPLLTFGIVSGTLWAVRLHPGTPTITPSQGFAVITWIVFGAVLLLRVAAGWRGKRAAIGTMLGFGCELAVLVGYVVRSQGGIT
jgi:ABC-type uncharacterized transport system permease subunit